MNKEPEISIIVPAYNEEARIVSTVKIIKRYFDKLGKSYEILIVDDGSKDRTREVVEELKIPELRVVSYGENRGKGYAINYGMQQANGSWILFTDADNSTPIEEFLPLSKQAEPNTVVIGSRYLPESNIVIKQSKARVAGSRIGNAITRALLLPGISDTQCGFKLFHKEAAKKIFNFQTVFGWGFDMEILRIAKEHGYKIKEVPITWKNDDQSKIQSSSVFLKTFIELLKIKRNSVFGVYRESKALFEMRRVIKFALVGSIGTIIDFAVLNTLHIPLGLNLYLSVSLGFIAGATNNYIFNSIWSFRQLLTWKKFSSFLWIAVVGLLLSNLIIYVVTTNLDWNYNVGKLIAVAVVFVWNYIMNRQITFRH